MAHNVALFITCLTDQFYPHVGVAVTKILEHFEYVVTPSGSCCAMVREQYHQLLGGDHAWEHGLHHVASRTYEFVEFLDKVLKVDLSKLSLPGEKHLTYHYTCHL